MIDVLTVRHDGPTWILELNRPEKRNALSPALVEALIGAVTAAHRDQAALLVLRGSGANFSAGIDLADIAHQTDGDLLMRFVRIQRLLTLLAASPCLTLGLAHGRNFGAGADLFAACRWRVAGDDFTFRMPGLKFGLLLGSRRLAKIAGAEPARRILEAARTLDATESLATGVVQRITPMTEWEGVVGEAAAASIAIPSDSRSLLYRALDACDADADMADVARSAGDYGLKQRILDYMRDTPQSK